MNMDITGVIVILLIACLILISVCLGLALGILLMLRKRDTKAIDSGLREAHPK